MGSSNRFEVVFTVSDQELPLETGLVERMMAKAGARLTCLDTSKLDTRSESKWSEALSTADGLMLCSWVWVDKNVISNLRNCKGIVTLSVGYDQIDVAAAADAGIVVCNLPDFCTVDVADHTIALILASIRKVTLLDASIKQGTWDWRISRPIPRLNTLVLGLVGYGRIGREVAKRAAAFGLKVVVFDRFVSPALVKEAGFDAVALDELLSKSDIISLHTPLNNETRKMIGQKQFAMMKRSAILVNTSRGGVVDSAALYDALRQGLLAGAALDTYAPEPPNQSDPLLKLKQVVMTPHIGGYSEDATHNSLVLSSEEMTRILNGQPPKNPIKPIAVPRTR